MALRILIVLLILAVPLELPGCGPFLPEAIFHLNVTPEAPLDFAHGQLGILQPSYERLYQVLAYRWLAGIGVSDSEAKAISPAAHEPAPEVAPSEPKNPWLEARNQVPGVKKIDSLDAFRQVKKQGYFDTYLNCNDDAFRSAAFTLQRVKGKPGAGDWIAAQDTVFADCSQGSAIPQPDSDPQWRSDRAYQIASAKFYSEQYDAAHQDFQAIGGDASSPWHEMAPYLAARCSIRAGKLDQAGMELRRIAGDPALPRWHAPANALLGYVGAHLHPPQRMHELALSLAKPNSAPTIGQDLIDYRMLFDRNIKPQPTDELTDWIVSFQAGGAGALDKWRAKHALPWLVGALQAAGPKDTSVPELLAAAATVKPGSPAYLTVSYHRIRLMPPDDARALAGQLLSSNLPLGGQNQIRAERMALARDFEEFLRYAPRTPVATMVDELVPADTKDRFLDEDASTLFNSYLPLDAWKRAQASTLLPAHLRAELGRIIFVRSLLLSDAPNFDQVYTLLHSPGMQLNIGAGYGRNTKEIDKIDEYRDNWWCAPDAAAKVVEVPPASKDGAPASSPEPAPAAPFLTPAERQKAADEAAKLRAAGAAPDWLAAQTVAYARQHPDDSRVPEALALAVRASRYGCTDAQTGDFSKRAFDLLHQRYANTEWARKTPYWYK